MAEMSTYELIRRRRKQIDEAAEGEEMTDEEAQARVERDYLKALEAEKEKKDETSWSLRNVIKRIRAMRMR